MSKVIYEKKNPDLQDAPERCRFFSIIVPAYNEERIIANTLSSLKELDYPQDRYEVIVVENASTDGTFLEAKKFESENFKIFSLFRKGVSAARNFGIGKVSDLLEWCIIMDADNFLEKGFLLELNQYLGETPGVHFGTTSIRPYPSNFKSRFWFWYRNWSDRLVKVMHTIHIVRRDVLKKVRYNEDVELTEDIQYSWDLLRHGKFFFMKTDRVFTSARRFEKKGYLKMFFINIYIGILPKKVIRRKRWETIR